MNSSLKLFLGILVTVAVFLLFQIGTSISSLIPTAEILDASQSRVSAPIFDHDNDGLDDAAESRYGTDASNPDTDGDGFLDGEEVLSGCNPVKRGPGDCKSDASRLNLFLHTVNLFAGGLVDGTLLGIGPVSSNDSLEDVLNRFPSGIGGGVDSSGNVTNSGSNGSGTGNGSGSGGSGTSGSGAGSNSGSGSSGSGSGGNGSGTGNGSGSGSNNNSGGTSSNYGQNSAILDDVGQISQDVQEKFLQKYPNKTTGDLLITSAGDPNTVDRYINEVTAIINGGIARSKRQILEEHAIAMDYYDFNRDKINPNFLTLRDQYLSGYEDLLQNTVPSDWSVEHIRIVNLAHHMAVSYDLLAHAHEDPLSAQLALEAIPTYIEGLRYSINLLNIKIADYRSLQ